METTRGHVAVQAAVAYRAASSVTRYTRESRDSAYRRGKLSSRSLQGSWGGVNVGVNLRAVRQLGIKQASFWAVWAIQSGENRYHHLQFTPGVVSLHTHVHRPRSPRRSPAKKPIAERRARPRRPLAHASGSKHSMKRNTQICTPSTSISTSSRAISAAISTSSRAIRLSVAALDATALRSFNSSSRSRCRDVNAASCAARMR